MQGRDVRHTFPPFVLDELQHECGEVATRLRDDVVLKGKQVSILRCLGNHVLDNVFRDLNEVTIGVQVVLGIEIVMDEMVAKSFHVSKAARLRSTIGVRRSEVCRIFACAKINP